jgi:hypothetical protein
MGRASGAEKIKIAFSKPPPDHSLPNHNANSISPCIDSPPNHTPKNRRNDHFTVMFSRIEEKNQKKR